MNESGPIPDLKIMCHRTGFTKTCRECVVDHGCRLWKRVTLEGHPETAKPVDHYDCADSLIDLYLKDMLRRQLQTTATVDKVANEVRNGNDAVLNSTLLRLNARMEEQQPLLGTETAPKLIEN